MWRCSSCSTRVKPLTKPGYRPWSFGVLEDQALPGHRQDPLGDHVVGDDALDEQLQVVGLGLDPVGDVAQRVVEEEVPGADVEQLLLDLADAGAQVVRVERHHLGHPAVEEDGVAHLVDELGREEGLDLAVRRGQQERGQVGGDALLADVEAAEAEGRLQLRLGRRLHPVLLVDREVELVGAPVLPLPQRVELLVVHQAALGPAGLGLGRITGVRARAVGAARGPRAPGGALRTGRGAGEPRARARVRRRPRRGPSSGRPGSPGESLRAAR